MKASETMSFSDRIKWRIRLLWVLFTAMFVYLVAIGERSLGNPQILARFSDTCGSLMFLCMLGWLVWRIRYNLDLLQMQQDEEEAYSQERCGKNGIVIWDILFVGLYFTTMTSSLWDMPVFHFSFTFFVIAVCAKIGTHLYYGHR